MRRLLSHSIFALGLVAAALVACSSDDTSTPNNNTSSSSGGTSSGGALDGADGVVNNYAENVYQNYSDILDEANKLQTAIKAFTDAPSDDTLEAAKKAWIAARKPYGPSEVYRFYEGPIDAEETDYEGNINSWPLDENFIDYTKDTKDGKDSLIGDNDFVITKETIKEKNTAGGEANVSDGYHAIEFLLWGQDNDPPADKTAGKRPVTDYTTDANAERRKSYLLAVTELLIDDLTAVRDAWAPDAEYRKSFVADSKTGLEKMLRGMGSLASGELAGERMSVAYTTKAQEDEHSCFSDNTDSDLQGNFIGIQNVYMGTYGSKSGDGVTKLVAAVDPDLDAKMKADLKTAEEAFDAIQAEPFDYSISLDDDAPERKNILAAINALKDIADDVSAVATKLGLSVTIETSDNTL